MEMAPSLWQAFPLPVGPRPPFMHHSEEPGSSGYLLEGLFSGLPKDFFSSD